jgi:hypothetical protein
VQVRLIRGNPVHRSLEGLHRAYHEIRWGCFDEEEHEGIRPAELLAHLDPAKRLLRASAPLYSAVVTPLLTLGDAVCRTHHFLRWDDRIYFTRYYPLVINYVIT